MTKRLGAGSKAAGKRAASSRQLDKFDCYEIAVQDPERTVRFLRALHGGRPRTFREDFAGGGALCRAWVEMAPEGRAIAIDRDRTPLRRLEGVERVETRVADVLQAPDRADVIAALNFPIGYWHERADLLRYLERTLRRLNRGGIFVADLYGGRDAYEILRLRSRIPLPDGGRLEYTWEQRTADPLTGRVTDALHFAAYPKRGRPRVHRNAFVYDWRLWSIPELRDAMHEAGFRSTEVHDRLGGAIDSDGTLLARPIGVGEALDPNYVAYVVARR